MPLYDTCKDKHKWTNARFPLQTTETHSPQEIFNFILQNTEKKNDMTS